MKNFWKKTTALLLLAIYTIYPLYESFHSLSDKPSLCTCSHSNCSPEVSSKSQSETSITNSILSDTNESHCLFCKNSQDRLYALFVHPDYSLTKKFPVRDQLCHYNDTPFSKDIHFVEYRGPPSLI